MNRIRYNPGVKIDENKPAKQFKNNQEAFNYSLKKRFTLLEQLKTAKSLAEETKIQNELLTLDMLTNAPENERLNKMQYEEDFYQWLQGTGDAKDHAITPWGRTPLTNMHPTIRDFLAKPIMEKMELQQKMHLRIAKGAPMNLQEAREYYDLVIKAKDNGHMDKLERYSVNNILERNSAALGEDLYGKILAYSQGRSVPGPLGLEYDLKPLASHLEDFLDVESSLGSEARKALRERVEKKGRLVDKLGYFLDDPKIRDAMRRYASVHGKYRDLIASLEKQIKDVRKTKTTAEWNAQSLAFHRKDLYYAGSASQRYLQKQIADLNTREAAIQAQIEEWQPLAREENPLDLMEIDEPPEWLKYLGRGVQAGDWVLYYNDVMELKALLEYVNQIVEMIEDFHGRDSILDRIAEEYSDDPHHLFDDLIDLYETCIDLIDRVLAMSNQNKREKAQTASTVRKNKKINAIMTDFHKLRAAMDSIVYNVNLEWFPAVCTPDMEHDMQKLVQIVPQIIQNLSKYENIAENGIR